MKPLILHLPWQREETRGQIMVMVSLKAFLFYSAAHGKAEKYGNGSVHVHTNKM